MAPSKSVPRQKISHEIISLQIQKSRFNPDFVFHPLIAHHAKRAHTYKVCCGPIETHEMSDQYLASFNLNSNQYYVMNKLLSHWFVRIPFLQVQAMKDFLFSVKQQAQTGIDEITVDTECSAAYNDLTNAMNARQK